jgi:hypothetical protein
VGVLPAFLRTVLAWHPAGVWAAITAGIELRFNARAFRRTKAHWEVTSGWLCNLVLLAPGLAKLRNNFHDTLQSTSALVSGPAGSPSVERASGPANTTRRCPSCRSQMEVGTRGEGTVGACARCAGADGSGKPAARIRAPPSERRAQESCFLAGRSSQSQTDMASILRPLADRQRLRYRQVGPMSECIHASLAAQGFQRDNSSSDWVLAWGSSLPEEKFAAMRPDQAHNHIPGSSRLRASLFRVSLSRATRPSLPSPQMLKYSSHTLLHAFHFLPLRRATSSLPAGWSKLNNKGVLAEVAEACRAKGQKVANNVPQSWVLPAGAQSLAKDQAAGGGPYILKPIGGTRGKGIKLFKQFSDGELKRLSRVVVQVCRKRAPFTAREPHAIEPGLQRSFALFFFASAVLRSFALPCALFFCVGGFACGAARRHARERARRAHDALVLQRYTPDPHPKPETRNPHPKPET